MIGFYDYTVIATYGALFIALHGIYSSAAGNPAAGLLCLICCGVIDTFDGRIARSKKDRTADGRRFGIQIDSLNDLVCFGVLPASIGAAFGMKSIVSHALLSLYVLAALIRLGYFNVTEEKRQEINRRPHPLPRPARHRGMHSDACRISHKLLHKRRRRQPVQYNVPDNGSGLHISTQNKKAPFARHNSRRSFDSC